MKSLMFATLLLISTLINAEQRFTDQDRAEFIKETKIDAQEFKAQNKGKFDLQLLKPFILQGLNEHNLNKKFSKSEMILIKAELEKYMKDPANNDNEEKFFQNLDAALAEISKKGLEKTKANGICNEFQCDKNLQCISDPNQNTDGRKCSIGSQECKIDSDCCSDECVDGKTKGRKLCAPIKRCYVPNKLGESCLKSPACEQGNCLPYNANTIGIGECVQKNNKCSTNSDCCSDLCSGGKCAYNLVCKSCANNGELAANGKKCCEGLYKGFDNYCAPDVPPIVPDEIGKPQSSNKYEILKNVLSIIIPSASAGEAYNVINGNRANYADAKPFEVYKDIVDFKTSAGLGLKTKSNFQSCEIHFREDFYSYLKEKKLFDQEISLLAFDYMLLGDANHDYWTKQKGNDESSINGRLQKIAKAHAEIRTKTNDKIAEINRKLTCMCIDVAGVEKASPANVTFFNTKCADFRSAFATDQNESSCNNLANEEKAYTESCSPITEGLTAKDCSDLKVALDQKKTTCAETPVEPTFLDDNKKGDASSVKSKRMLVFFTAQMSSFNQTLTVDNTKVYQGIAEVRDWIKTEGYKKLATTDSKTYDLGDFTLNGYAQSAQAIGAAVLGALLAAGVIAVLGGFATTSMISAWAAAGIITAAAATSGGGVWMVASLKGAWIAKRPVVADQFLRTQSCGKKGKNTCTDWKRNLVQPYNPICDAHISANACVKNFLAYPGTLVNADFPETSVEEFHQSVASKAFIYRYLVDPFIPVDVTRAKLLRGQGDHAKNLEAGFQRALSGMYSKARHGKIGEDYMWSEFIDDNMTGYYAPNLGGNPEENYLLNQELVSNIKQNAKKFAIDNLFLVKDDEENLQKFANYAFQYHFLWPKTTLEQEVSYPTVALDTYLDFMANGVAAKLSVGGANAAMSFGGLNSKYLQDYLNTLKMYESQASNLSDAQMKSLQAEIAGAQEALAANKKVADMIASGADLSVFNKDSLNSGGSKTGSSAGNLTSSQQAFTQAIGNYRKLRNEQVKKSEAFKKAAIANGNNKQRTASVSKAFASFGSRFSSPLTASLGKISGMNSGSGANGSATSAKDTGTGTGIKYNFGSGAGGIGSGFGASGAVGGGSSNSGKSSSSSSSSGTGNDNGENGAAGSKDDEDAKRLAQAVEARDKANANKFNSTENNSLFEKVTNAYIRNYDKVLTKKKQEKDIVDKKEE